MDTVQINGKEVPISELISTFHKAATLEGEVAQLRTTQQSTNEQLAQAARAQQAIERARTDPEFAKTMIDSIRDIHKGSAFMQESAPPAPPAPNGDPLVTDAPAPTPNANLELAQQVETMRREMAGMQSQRLLDAKIEELQAKFPTVDPTELIKRALENELPLEHLGILAQAMDQERLATEAAKVSTNNDLLEGLLSGAGGTTAEDNLARLGSNVSAAALAGDAEVDYASMDPRDAVLLAMKDLGAPASV